jgi:hypothetical protein
MNAESEMEKRTLMLMIELRGLGSLLKLGEGQLG